MVIINSGFTNVELTKICECCHDVKIQLLVLVFTEFCNVQNSQTSPVVSPVMVIDICDLSRDNVPNASRSNAERNGKRTGDERLGKPFETGTVNG